MEDELLLQGGDEGVLQHKESSDVTINTALRRKKHSMKVGTTDFRSNISADELKTKKKSHEEIDSSMVFNWFLTVGAQAKETLQHLLLDEGDSDHENEDLHSLKEQRSSDGKKHVIRNTNTSPTKSPSKYSKPASRYIYSNGVGKVRIHLISAQRVEVIDSAEGDHHAVISLEEFAHGQSYALTAADIQYAELRTKTVRSSATPVFDKKWTLGVPTYQSCLKIALIDSGDNSVVGVSKIPIYSMIMGKYGHSIDKKKKHRLIQEEIIPMRNPNDPTIVTGHFSVDISFEEDVQALFLAKIPKQARVPDEESLSVERLVKHIGRFQLLINLVGAIFSEYLDLMNWKDFIFTSTMLLVFVYTALKINAEYALCCPVFLALCLFTRAYYRRVSGTYEKETIGRMKNNNDPYRPIATLTMAVLETKYGKDPLLTNSKPIGNAESNPVSLASLWGLSLSSLRPHVIHQKPFIAILYRPMRGDFLKLKKNEVISENRTFLVGSIRGGDDSGPTIVTSRHSAHAPSDTRSKDAILHNLLMPWPKPPATEITQTVSIANAQDETAEDLAFVYPLLQPVWKNVIASHAQESIADLEKPAMSTDKKSSTVPEKQIPAKKNKVYVPWEENESEIILSFHHEKPSHGLIESMTSVVNDIGQVVIPLKSFLDESIKDSDKMVYYRRPSEDVVEICQWFPVIPTISEVNVFF